MDTKQEHEPWFPVNPQRKAVLKSSGGDIVDLTQDVIFERMDQLSPHWRDENSLTMFPIMPKPKYEGPVGMDGVKESLEKGHKDHVKGSVNEAQVLKGLEELGRSHNRGLKIFHGVPVSLLKLEALCTVFGKEMPDEGFWNEHSAILAEFPMDEGKKPVIDKEFDIVVVTKCSVVLMEVKSSPDEVNTATKQLRKAEFVFSILLRILQVSIPIKKVVAVPLMEGKNYDNKVEVAARENASLLDINKQLSDQQKLSKIFSEDDDPEIQDDDLKRILASLAFMHCSYYYPNQSEDLEMVEKELKEALSEPEAVGTLAKKLQDQSLLEKSKSSKVEKVETLAPNEYIWLDPIQSLVMKCSSKKVFISGPAGTGKTVLLQLKIVQILKTNPESKILVFFPPWPSSGALAAMYCNSLKRLCTLEMLRRVRLINVDITHSGTNVKYALKWKPTHTFIEEFKAFQSDEDVCTNGLNKLRDFALKPETFVWIALDVLQGFGSSNNQDLEGNWQQFIKGNLYNKGVCVHPE